MDEERESSSIGRALRVIRNAKDLSRKAFASRAGLSYSYVAEIETGAKTPSAKALAQLAEALEVSVAELYAAAERWEASPPPHSFEELRGTRAGAPPEAQAEFSELSARYDPDPPQTQMRSASTRRALLRSTRRRGDTGAGEPGEADLYQALHNLRESDGGISHAADLLQRVALLAPEDRARLLDLAERLTDD